jgi:hypothetical protein
MDEDVKAKLTAAWQTAVARLIETGYAPKDVYDTMISVGLSGAEDRANDNHRPSGEVRPRTGRPSRPLRMVVLGGAIVLAILVPLVLGTQQRTAYESFATEGVRVGDPGHNLVGPDWSGDAGEKGKR